MSKIFNFYSNNIDYNWFESSNVKYSECIDNENALKTLRVTFNNGKTYQYDDVHVRDYLLFREDASQGKALNEYIKKKGYSYAKIEDRDCNKLDEELKCRSHNGVLLMERDNHTILCDSKNNTLCDFKKQLDDSEENLIVQAVMALGHFIMIKKD